MNNLEPPPPGKESPVELDIYYVEGRDTSAQAKYQAQPSRPSVQPAELSREDKNIIRFVSVVMVAAAIAVGGTFTETLVDIDQYNRFNPPRQTSDPLSWVAAPIANYYEQLKGNGPYSR